MTREKESGKKSYQLTPSKLALLSEQASKKKKHPNLFELIELIKQEQTATEVEIIQLTGSGLSRPKHKMQRCEDQIKKLTSDFDNGHLKYSPSFLVLLIW